MSLSKQLIPNLFRMHNAQDFVNSVSSNATYYVFTGRHFPFTGGDPTVEQPLDSYQNMNFSLYQDMIFGKKVTTSDVKMMIKRHDWASNTVYSEYDKQDYLLSTKQFYVGIDSGANYDVFKCLFNNGGLPSTSVPNKTDTDETSNYYETSDGYRWKYMFSITSATMDKFATTDYIPVMNNANVIANAVPGAINVIKVLDGGNGYINYTSGVLSVADIKLSGNALLYSVKNSFSSSTSDMYNGCYLYISGGTGQGNFAEINRYTVNSSGKIVELKSPLSVDPAEGSTFDISPKVIINGAETETTEAQARAIISGSTVASIQMIEDTPGLAPGGKGYAYATAYVYTDPVVGIFNANNSANLYPIISPIEGHGGNPEEELFASSAGISVHFANTESNTIFAGSSYRTIGLIRNPLYSNVVIPVANVTGFSTGEFVVQANIHACGYIYSKNTTALFLTNVAGEFVLGNTTYALVTGQTNGNTTYVNASIIVSGNVKGFSTFDQTWKFAGSFGGSGDAFANDEPVYQVNSAVSNAYYLTSNSSSISLTNKFGVFGGNVITGSISMATFVINNTNFETKPDIISGTGDILYVENFEPIDRSNSQTETAKLIILF